MLNKMAREKKKKTVQQVLGGRCKGETLFFRIVVDLIVKKVFQRHLNFREQKKKYSRDL